MGYHDTSEAATMTRALVLHAHPLGDSYAAALHGTVVQTLRGRGWTVDDCDLYAEGFNPVLSAEERTHYHDLERNTAPVAEHVARLREATALVLCFPVWNYGYPAILKGYFDRVFLPGVSFRLEGGKVVPNLTHIRRLAAVTTYGGSRARAVFAGDPPRNVVKRALWHVTRPEKLRYIALYDLNRAPDARRTAFLTQVRREMESF